MSRPVVALCTWEDWNYGHKGGDASYWQSRGEVQAACRASLGEKFLTVWLPQGAVIRKRLGRFGNPEAHMSARYTDHFGSHERMSRARIVIHLTELPTL